MTPSTDYVELRCRSAFSFLAGASLPEDLIERAAALGYDTLALADARGVYGAPRARGRDQRRAPRRARGPAAPRRPHLHPPRYDARPGGAAAPRQRGAAPEVAGGDGGALPGHARCHPPEPPHRRALRVHARGPGLPFPGVPARARRDADRPPAGAHLRWRPRSVPNHHAGSPETARARARHDRAFRPRRPR